MASAITLEGIDQAISNLKYKNQSTLKYRFVHHIRQYYTTENAVVTLNEINHEELIEMLWDVDHRIENIKDKRKNLNSVRSSVNADFKKLFEKGENPEGIKIGPSNIFVMSEDAKDNILKKLGYDLQPDGTLKLDQIMDILKLASETVSGSMAVEDTEKKEGLRKIDRLKDLIKGLSEKVGLGSTESSKEALVSDDKVGRGDKDGSGSKEMAGVLDEAPLDEAEEIADLEDEVEVVDDVDDGEELDEEEIVDDVEDVEIDEIVDSDPEDPVDATDIDEETEEVLEEADAELEDVEEEIIDDDISDDILEELGSGGEDTGDGVSVGQESGEDNGGAETLSRGIRKGGLEFAGKENGKDTGYDNEETTEHGFEAGEEQRESEQLGLPVESLGQEYHIEKDGKIKNNRLLAEEFDGFLGSMDRYYNQYILIPGGEYLIGSRNPEKDEKYEQKVNLEPFYIGRFPITNGLFEIFVEKTGYKTTAEKVGYGTVYYGRFEKKRDDRTGLITSTWNSSLYCKTVRGACWYQPSGPKSTLYNKRNHPVVQISMEDAAAFAAWTGKRLPTENEWEAASRTVNGWILPWGHEWKEDACNVEDSHTADTTPVDKYLEFENNYGIVDTLGNVLEWTNNSFDSTPTEIHGTKFKIAKGGSWISGNDIRLFNRFMIGVELHSNILGFRCVAY